MYRFLLRPRWLAFHLLVAAAVVLMVNLAFWQLRRLDERKDFNAEVSSRIDEPVEPLADLLPVGTGLDDAAVETSEWRPVEATGRYGEPQVVIVNRSQGGRAGTMIVSPLLLDDGRVLLVERGFVSLGDDPDAPPPPTPDGDVTVTGRLRESQERRRGGLTDPDDGVLTVAQRIDLERLAPQFDGPVVPMYLELVSSTPGIEPGVDPAPVELPTLDEGSHLSYTVQWFIFAMCAVVGWAIAVRRSAATRDQERRTAAKAAAGESAPAEPDGVDAPV